MIKLGSELTFFGFKCSSMLALWGPYRLLYKKNFDSIIKDYFLSEILGFPLNTPENRNELRVEDGGGARGASFF